MTSNKVIDKKTKREVVSFINTLYRKFVPKTFKSKIFEDTKLEFIDKILCFIPAEERDKVIKKALTPRPYKKKGKHTFSFTLIYSYVVLRLHF